MFLIMSTKYGKSYVSYKERPEHMKVVLISTPRNEMKYQLTVHYTIRQFCAIIDLDCFEFQISVSS
jgi:hypothetical protein